MPQQNLGEEKHLIDHPDECLGVSEVFFFFCAEINKPVQMMQLLAL